MTDQQCMASPCVNTRRIRLEMNVPLSSGFLLMSDCIVRGWGQIISVHSFCVLYTQGAFETYAATFSLMLEMLLYPHSYMLSKRVLTLSPCWQALNYCTFLNPPPSPPPVPTPGPVVTLRHVLDRWWSP